MRNRNRNRKGPNPLSRSYESNGGDVKIRGTALHVAEKYVQLARDAQSSGDRVAGENYLQHAEHYYRIVAAAQAQMPQPQQFYRNDEGEEGDEEGDASGGYNGNNNNGNPYPQGGGERPPYAGGPQGQQRQNAEPGPSPHYGNANGNGTSGEQPAFEGQQNEPRGDDNNRPYNNNNNNNNQNNQGGGGDRGGNNNNFRGRRRRPYRDQYAGGGGNGNNNAPTTPEQPAGGFDAPPSDENS
jgi:hypothetical protein